jgi:glycosyltransferase involved in cell wall biosynthesis
MADSSFASFVSSLEQEVSGTTTETVTTATTATTATATTAATTVPLKILIVSTHINQGSGYSKISYGMLKELAKQPSLAVVHFGIQSANIKYNRTYPSNIKVYDVIALEKENEGGFGYSVLPEIVLKERPDVVLLYNDIGVVNNYLAKIAPLRAGTGGLNFKIWTYLDQVYECQLQMHLETCQKETDRFFTFTKEWRDVLKRQNVSRPIDVLLHGYDGSIFPKMSKAEARKLMNIPDEIFLFMSLNRNQPRKRLDLLIMAFVELITKHPSKPLFLMCVCDKGEKGGFPLFDIFARELILRGFPVDKFANRLLITPKEMSYQDEEIGKFYKIADVGLSTADGEGFGLCAFEQMGQGIPQVLTNVVGHREYCRPDNSILVDATFRGYLPLCMSNLGGETRSVDYRAFASAMETYVFNEEIRILHGANAKQKVEEYTWSSVMASFIKRLDLLRSELALDE